MSARQVTDLVLNNKVGYLSDADRNALAQKMERNNPSVFENGKVKEGFDTSKLDIPTMNYIKSEYVESRNVTAHNGTGEYTSKTDGKKHKIEQTVTSNTGRTAKKVDGKWHYHAKDGTELNEGHINNNDKDLRRQTHS